MKRVHNANARLSMVQQARANPNHSRISPKKLAPLTYSNIPPESRTELLQNTLVKMFNVTFSVYQVGAILLISLFDL